MPKVKSKTAKRIVKKPKQKQPADNIEVLMYRNDGAIDNKNPATQPMPYEFSTRVQSFIDVVKNKSIELKRLDKFVSSHIIIEGKPCLQLCWEFTGAVGYASRYSIGSIVRCADIEKIIDLNAFIDSTIQHTANLQRKFIGT